MNNINLGKALIVDDEKTNRLILKSLLKKQGYDCIEAVNGREAVELFHEQTPSIIFMDVMMPEVDGYEAARQIKAASGEHFVPIIFLTAMTDEEALGRCIDAGGDDVLVKPYDSFILSTKIRAMQRISMLNREVQSMYRMIHREQEIAESVFINAVQGHNISNPHIKSKIRPASTFSGDMMLSAYSPSQDLFFLIGDFTGHGLSAALGAMPVSEVFHAMVSKGFRAEDILNGINKKLKSLLPVGMFFGVQLVVVDKQLEYATVFNAGMPDLLVVDGATNEVSHRIISSGLPLGIVADINAREICEFVPIKPNDKILMYSDGLIEARNSEDEEFCESRLINAINQAPSNKVYDHIFQRLDLFCGDIAQVDDVTLVELTCLKELVLNEEVIGPQHPAPKTLSNHGEWRLALNFSGKRLRETNPVPIIVNHILEMENFAEERQSFFTVITELYKNALDHGVLGLESSLKSDHSGFSGYHKERKARLSALETGYVNFELAVEQLGDRRSIHLRIEDSGEGFDYQNYQPEEEDTATLSGRGLILVENLCDSLSFEGKGNIAIASFIWVS